jgi:hypothetical protein
MAVQEKSQKEHILAALRLNSRKSIKNSIPDFRNFSSQKYFIAPYIALLPLRIKCPVKGQ